MPLKYQQQLNSFQPNCPNPTRFVERAAVGYRFLMESPAVQNDFLPKAFSPDECKDFSCAHYALSFFTTVEKAQSKINELNKKINANKRHGNFFGKVNILTTDGLTSLPATSGHFAVHEYENVTFIGRVEEYTPIQNRGPDVA